MKLQFFLDRVRRDLNLVPQKFVESEGAQMAKLEDVMRVVERWEMALATEDTLTREAQRFDELLNKEGALTRSEHAEAFTLLMLIHMPLVEGQNDVMGYRLQNADYFRLNNKLLGRDAEDGLVAHDEQYNDMIKKRNEAADKKRKAKEAQKRKAQDAEAKRVADQMRRYLTPE